jgi:hypothetical protein
MEGGKRYFRAVKQAAENNILVLHPDFKVPKEQLLEWYYLLGANCPYPNDKDKHDNYQVDRWKKVDMRQYNILQKITNQADDWIEFEERLDNKIDYLEQQDDWRLILTNLKSNLPELKAKYNTIAELRTGIEKIINLFSVKTLHVPSQSITVASDKGRDEYIFSGEGGISWLLPYYTGVVALVLQANPQLTNEEVVDLIDETAVVNENGLRMIAPQKAVKRALVRKQD